MAIDKRRARLPHTHATISATSEPNKHVRHTRVRTRVGAASPMPPVCGGAPASIVVVTDEKTRALNLMSAAEDAAEKLRSIAQVARYRNGRLAIDWISRREKPRWRMVRLDDQYYDRQRLRKLLNSGRTSPSLPRRRLTAAELASIRDPNPWRLYDKPRPAT